MGKIDDRTGGNIDIEYDSEGGDYYIVWSPMVIGAGQTEREALEDLRAAAHSGVDTLINLELKNITEEG